MVVTKLCDPTSEKDDTNTPTERLGAVLVFVDEDGTKRVDSTSEIDDNDTVVIALALPNVRVEEATA